MANNLVLPKALNNSSGIKKVLKAVANKHKPSKLNLHGGKKPSKNTGLTRGSK